MSEQIFKSLFTLKFAKEEIENEFMERKIQNLKYFNKKLILGLFISSAGVTLMNSFFLEHLDQLMFQCVLYTSYLTSFILFIFIFISFFCKNINVIRYIHYINYFLIWLISVNFRYTILRIIKVDIVVNFLVIVEILLRLIWVLLGIHGFIDSFVLICLTIASMWILYPPIFDKNVYTSGMLNWLGYSIALITVIIFAYILVRKEKIAFYFHWMSDKERKWLYNVFENMKTGFLSVKTDTITYMNRYLIRKIEKIKRDDFNSDTEAIELCISENPDNNLKFNQINAQEMLKKLLFNIKTDSINDPIVSKIMTNFKREIETNENSNQNFIKTFTKYITQINDIETFKLIGDNVILVDDTEISFELHCRFIKSNKNEDEIEFLLNDVTRTKLKEKQNAEFKYKTLFLSKVGHEFKNPIICITELVNRLHDNLEGANEEDILYTKKSLLEDLNQIKSLSNFLLVLTKDLNYFSEIQMGKGISLIKKEEDLSEIIKFVKDVGDSLINKSNKKDAIKFITKVDENVPNKILTDQWRLKQVLINLVSNACKFTLYGNINLEVSLEERTDNKKYIKFLVSDTGTGIKEEDKSKLFIPFTKGISDTMNEMGSGLGLSIANEIASIIGERISFTSEVGVGSKFWFFTSLPEDINILDEKKNLVEENKSEDVSLIINRDNNIEEVCDDSKDTYSNDVIPPFNYENDFNPITKSEIKEEIRLIKPKTNSLNKNYSTIDFLSDNISDLRKVNSNLNEEKEITIKNKFINIIVVDDENMTRLSVIRIIHSLSKDLGININIIEAEDGVECVYLVYKALSLGVKISMIFSDEHMNFMNGSKSSVIIKEITDKKNIVPIPFYLVTAFDFNLIDQVSSSINKILAKPLNKEMAKDLIKDYLNK